MYKICIKICIICIDIKSIYPTRETWMCALFLTESHGISPCVLLMTHIAVISTRYGSPFLHQKVAQNCECRWNTSLKNFPLCLFSTMSTWMCMLQLAKTATFQDTKSSVISLAFSVFVNSLEKRLICGLVGAPIFTLFLL